MSIWPVNSKLHPRRRAGPSATRWRPCSTAFDDRRRRGPARTGAGVIKFDGRRAGPANAVSQAFPPLVARPARLPDPLFVADAQCLRPVPASGRARCAQAPHVSAEFASDCPSHRPLAMRLGLSATPSEVRAKLPRQSAAIPPDCQQSRVFCQSAIPGACQRLQSAGHWTSSSAAAFYGAARTPHPVSFSSVAILNAVGCGDRHDVHNRRHDLRRWREGRAVDWHRDFGGRTPLGERMASRPNASDPGAATMRSATSRWNIKVKRHSTRGGHVITALSQPTANAVPTL